MAEKTQEKSIYSKLLLVQNEITGIKKGSTNPFFKSQYFDVNALIQALRPVLQSNRLVLVQPLVYREGKQLLSTQLIDVDSGEIIESTMDLPTISDPQKVGSIITYYRRYSIQSLFLLESVDDDGETGAGRGKLASKIDHGAALSKMNTVDELRLYLAKYPDDKNVLMPLLTARKLEITQSN